MSLIATSRGIVLAEIKKLRENDLAEIKHRLQVHDRRFDRIDERLGGIDGRLDGMDERLARIEALIREKL